MSDITETTTTTSTEESVTEPALETTSTEEPVTESLQPSIPHGWSHLCGCHDHIIYRKTDEPATRTGCFRYEVVNTMTSERLLYLYIQPARDPVQYLIFQLRVYNKGYTLDESCPFEAMRSTQPATIMEDTPTTEPAATEETTV